jgi:hypothetical protein
MRGADCLRPAYQVHLALLAWRLACHHVAAYWRRAKHAWRPRSVALCTRSPLHHRDPARIMTPVPGPLSAAGSSPDLATRPGSDPPPGHAPSLADSYH